MNKWYIIKKKTETRWVAYELEGKPVLKRGYEMQGPFDSFAQCLIASDKQEQK